MDSSNRLLEKENQSNFSNQSLSCPLLVQIICLIIVCDYRELLKGPLYYVLMLLVCALVFWRESPTGVLALGMMCAGDGNFTCSLFI